MRRYKKYKPCPNNGVRCGNSKRCWPAGTVCGEEKSKKEKPEKAEKKLNISALVAGAAVVTLIGGATYHVVGRQKTLIPKAAETKRDPQSASDVPVEKYSGKIDTYRGSPETGTDDRKVNQRKAQNWAREVLEDPNTVIIDFETTALFDNVDPADPSAFKKYRNDVPGIFQIGIVDGKMENAWDIKLDPEKKIGKGAQRVTGMSDRDIKELGNKPTFKEYYPYLRKKLENKRVLAFNSRFDLQVLDAMCVKNGLEIIPMQNRVQAKPRKSDGLITDYPIGNDADVMHWFALYKGKRGRPSLKAGEYDTSTSLAYTQLPTIPGGKAHDALTDVISTYDALRIMAEGRVPRDMRPSEQKVWEEIRYGKK